ncbi:hypothetical protein FOVSG1_006220 [Fusarium oxysporum f. sp. vasinfectum]
MGSGSLPAPLAEDQELTSRSDTSSSSKPDEPGHHTSRRIRSNATTIRHRHHHAPHITGMDGGPKRCDSKYPCKRCKDDGLICAPGIRKKTKYKQLPEGYAEVLENTQFTLIATIYELYSMVRNNKSWDLGEPELNDRGLPLIHSIAQKLGCIHPDSDIDLSVCSVFPEDEASMAELAQTFEDQGNEYKAQKESLYDTDPSVIDPSTLFSFQSPAMNNFPALPVARPLPDDLTVGFLQQQNGMTAEVELFNQSSVGFEVDTIKPDLFSYPISGVILGMADPMISSGYTGEPMQL